MEKYTQLLGRVVTISTYAIMFCVVGNMVVPALTVESVNAQAVTSSSTAQAQADAAKKALDKVQADAKTASYKELGLTKAEIAFSEDKSFDMNAINQKVDKYVTYDKNAVALLNTEAYRKDGTVKLSKVNTELVISITNKMIAKYNSDLRSAKSKYSVSGTTAFSASVENQNYGISKTNDGRGYVVKVAVIQQNQDLSKVASAQFSGNIITCRTMLYAQNVYQYWWGTNSFMFMNKCTAQAYADIAQNRMQVTVLTGAIACGGLAVFGLLPGFACGAIIAFIGYGMATYIDSLNYLIRVCRTNITFWVTSSRVFGNYMHDLNCSLM